MTIAARHGVRRQQFADASHRTQAEFRPAQAEGQWLGEPGHPIKATARVEAIQPQGHGRVTYRLRDNHTDAILEWTSARRYGFHLGEVLHLAGRVYRHSTHAGMRITEIRECFNPMRLA